MQRDYNESTGSTEPKGRREVGENEEEREAKMSQASKNNHHDGVPSCWADGCRCRLPITTIGSCHIGRRGQEQPVQEQVRLAPRPCRDTATRKTLPLPRQNAETHSAVSSTLVRLRPLAIAITVSPRLESPLASLHASAGTLRGCAGVQTSVQSAPGSSACLKGIVSKPNNASPQYPGCDETC
ncbi:hypothetical protein M011DRAFT_172333 [Sporormia fimetaria CBS 119925]|uniref:Uncharacterized protein n=1 Tax=Sporormia fimetaria CBS 119925 TaxID=1340428 RepID=A0A6A6V4D4_9PLEO|nr:hypothetical protein M011DRAFT_172333 [Sporormia fimetaria CBS 119925]